MNSVLHVPCYRAPYVSSRPDCDRGLSLVFVANQIGRTFDGKAFGYIERVRIAPDVLLWVSMTTSGTQTNLVASSLAKQPVYGPALITGVDLDDDEPVSLPDSAIPVLRDITETLWLEITLAMSEETAE